MTFLLWWPKQTKTNVKLGIPINSLFWYHFMPFQHFFHLQCSSDNFWNMPIYPLAQ